MLDKLWQCQEAAKESTLSCSLAGLQGSDSFAADGRWYEVILVRLYKWPLLLFVVPKTDSCLDPRDDGAEGCNTDVVGSEVAVRLPLSARRKETFCPMWR